MDADIAVAGCGIAGLEVALRLERKGYDVTVVDPRSAMTFYPAVHHILGGADIAEAQIDLAERFAGRNVRHIREKVAGAEPAEDRLLLEDGRALDYDTLVVAVGAKTHYGTIRGEGNVHDLRFRDDTVAITEEISHPDVEDVCIVGGGATGIEAAASLSSAERYGDFSLTVLESAERLLPQFTPKLGDAVEARFARRGVAVRTGTRVDRITADAVVLEDGEELESDLTIWAGGVRPHPVIQEMGLPATDRGFRVDDHLRVEGHDSVYAAGDVADYDGKVNRAFYALGEAKTVAANVHRARTGKPLTEHGIGWDPNLIQLGPRDAVFEFRGVTFGGFIPYLMRHIGVEQRYLVTRRHLL